jgi:hypothetical protein
MNEQDKMKQERNRVTLAWSSQDHLRRLQIGHHFPLEGVGEAEKMVVQDCRPCLFEV